MGLDDHRPSGTVVRHLARVEIAGAGEYELLVCLELRPTDGATGPEGVESAAPPDGGSSANGLTPDRPLTARELQVLALLSEGRTNREVATALHITPGTVATHVRHIFRKLDVDNRRQLLGSRLADPHGDVTA